MNDPLLAPLQIGSTAKSTTPSKRAHVKRRRLSPDEGYILRILSEARSPLFPSQVTERVNYELISGAPYTLTEVAMRLMAMNHKVDQLSDGSWMLKARRDRAS